MSDYNLCYSKKNTKFRDMMSLKFILFISYVPIYFQTYIRKVIEKVLYVVRGTIEDDMKRLVNP